jgi:hypothetical protein
MMSFTSSQFQFAKILTDKLGCGFLGNVGSGTDVTFFKNIFAEKFGKKWRF